MNINQYSISKDIIFHIINKDSVEKLLKQKFYSPVSLENDGFIHFSKKEQVSWVIETFYSSKEELYVLGVDTKKLTAPLKYEGASIDIEIDSVPPEKTDFPHLYGSLNVDAIVNIIEAVAFFEQEMDTQVAKMIDLYAFDRLPVECTFYKSTYTSSEMTHNGRLYGTAMIGMYSHQPLSLSCFHRLKHDEVWHAYGGDPFRLVLLHIDGTTKEIVMGNEAHKGQVVQYVIPANTWQAGELIDGGRYALFGCTMAPGFHPEDFEAGSVDMLRKQYPDRLLDILRFNVNGKYTKMSL